MKYKMELTARDIVEAFPEECEEYVVPMIVKLQYELDEYKKLEHEAKYYTGDLLLRTFKLGVLEMDKPKEKFTHLQRLQAMKKIMGKEEIRGHITDENILQAKKISIVTLYPFKKAKMYGNRFTACCPFHNEKTPSFTVFADNHYHCFGCHKTGDSINFIQELNSLTFLDAVKFLNAQKI